MAKCHARDREAEAKKTTWEHMSQRGHPESLNSIDSRLCGSDIFYSTKFLKCFILSLVYSN